LFARLSVQHYFFAYRILSLILMLIACRCGKCAIIYVFCRSPNDHIEKKRLSHTYNVYFMPNGRFFQMENACHLSICLQHFKKITFF